MNKQTDEDEHSIEMHLPYIRKIFEKYQFYANWVGHFLIYFLSTDIHIIPILVGAISASKEELYGKILGPYLLQEDTFFVISSDFCHW